MTLTPRFAGALVGAIAALGVAGAGWAYAQESPTTTTPPTTAAPSQDGTQGTTQDGRHCDHDRGTDTTPSTVSPTSATDL